MRSEPLSVWVAAVRAEGGKPPADMPVLVWLERVARRVKGNQGESAAGRKEA